MIMILIMIMIITITMIIKKMKIRFGHWDMILQPNNLHHQQV